MPNVCQLSIQNQDSKSLLSSFIFSRPAHKLVVTSFTFRCWLLSFIFTNNRTITTNMVIRFYTFTPKQFTEKLSTKSPFLVLPPRCSAAIRPINISSSCHFLINFHTHRFVFFVILERTTVLST